MKHTEVLEKRALFGSAKKWVVDKYNQIADKTNQHIKNRYVEPQARAAVSAGTAEIFKQIGKYAVPSLIGAGALGLATHGVVDWLNSKRKKDEAKLPTGLLTTLSAISGGLGSAYLYDKFFKQGSSEIPIEVQPSDVVSPEEQEALEDPSGKKKKKPEKADNIQQMIYALKAKQRVKAMKMASLTYSKVAELMGNTTDPTPGQEWDSFRMAHANPGVSFMWDAEKRQYVPHTYDKTQKTNVPYTGKINQPAPLTEDQQWDRKMYIRSKQMPMTSTTTGSTTTTQGNGTFRFGQYTQDTNFTIPKPVQPVQPPQYRQADTTVKDVEGFR